MGKVRVECALSPDEKEDTAECRVSDIKGIGLTENANEWGYRYVHISDPITRNNTDVICT